MDTPLASLAWACGALAAILLAIIAAAPILRRAAALGQGRAGRRLQLIEVMALDPRRRLLLVRCDGRELLLLTGGSTDRVVGWLPAGDRAAGAAPDPQDPA